MFLGTPEFAVASLDALMRAGFPIAGVVTAPDKPSGRGMKMSESDVKKYALEHKLPVLQPIKLKDAEFLAQLQALRADLQVVVAFRMLPDVVWNMPRMGTVNLHASLLPQYRGAAPINWAIINGEEETGLTTFKLQHEIDTGNILLQETLSIGPEETAGELHDRMKSAGAELLVRTIEGLIKGDLVEIPQRLSDVQREGNWQSALAEDAAVAPLELPVLKLAPKITKETGEIDWKHTTHEVYNLIRGLSPYPGAFTLFRGKILKLYAGKMEPAPTDTKPGEWRTDKKTYLKWTTADGYLHATDVQLEGKKRMTIDNFLRGYRWDDADNGNGQSN